MAEILHYLGLPINMSVDGPAIDEVIILTHWLMLVLFIGWGAFFIVSLVKFRSSKNPNADHDGVKSHFSSVLEVVVAVIEMVLLVGFALPIWASRINDVPEVNSGAVHARVIAQQYQWNIHYAGDDGVFGKTHASKVNEGEGNYIGLIDKDALKYAFVLENDTLTDEDNDTLEYILDENNDGIPDWKDDIIEMNNLHIPVNKKIRIDLSSKDVIHSFSLPELRVKQDVIPGMSIPVHFEATKTSSEFLAEMVGTPREGKGLEIACAQLCGISHYRMKGYLKIHTQESFNDWFINKTDSLLNLDSEQIVPVLNEWDDEDDW